MAKGGREYKSEFSTTGKPQDENKSDLIDKNINFDKQEMHKTWPMVKGCLMLLGAIAAFVFLSIYVFKNFGKFFS